MCKHALSACVRVRMQVQDLEQQNVGLQQRLQQLLQDAACQSRQAEAQITIMQKRAVRQSERTREIALLCQLQVLGTCASACMPPRIHSILRILTQLSLPCVELTRISWLAFVRVCRQADQLDKLNRIARGDGEQPATMAASHLHAPLNDGCYERKTEAGTAVYKETGPPSQPVPVPNSRTRHARDPHVNAGGACRLTGNALAESNPTELQIDRKHTGVFDGGDVTSKFAEQQESGGKGSHYVASLADCLISFKLPSSSSSPLRKNISESSSVGSTVRVDPVRLLSRRSDEATAGERQVEEGRGSGAAAASHENVVGMEMGEWARREEELLQSLKAKWRNRSSA